MQHWFARLKAETRPQGFRGRPLEEGIMADRKYTLTTDVIETIDKVAEVAEVAKSDVVDFAIREVFGSPDKVLDFARRKASAPTNDIDDILNE